MFRNRKDDDLLADDTSPAQASLLAGAPEETQAAAAPAAASTSPIAGYQVNAAPRSVGEPITRPQSSIPTALNPFRSVPASADAARPRNTETKTSAFTGSVSGASGKDSRRVLTVGSDILLKGEIATCDRLVIEGKVDAVLNDVGTVELAESGSFKGVAQVENAEISGLFEGELVVKSRLVIYASGRVRGKITYGEIEIERGGELTGDIKTIAAAGNAAAARPRTSAAAAPAAKKEEAAAA